MPNPQPFEFDFTPDALNRALLGDGDDLDFDSEILEHEELHSVARRIAGSHVEVVARFARTVFSGVATRPDLHQFSAALGHLERLAEAARDTAQEALLADLRGFVLEHLPALEGKRGRNVLIPRVQRFLDAFAECLDGDDAARLARLVRYDHHTAPLLAELATLRGIGPRRLERLYCCGLYTVEVVAHAQASDLAAVSGLPLQLSQEVVAASRAWATQRRAASIDLAQSAIAEFEAMAVALREPVPSEVVAEARAVAAELSRILSLIDGGRT